MGAYLDHASAAPWHPAALAAHARVAAELPGDPTRLHSPGRAARDLLEQARTAVAAAVGTAHEGLTFTSGGTEAVHLAIRGTALGNRARPPRILSAAVEHSAVLAAGDAAAATLGTEHVRLRVDGHGRIDLDHLDAELAEGALLVNLQHANHEVGTLQPVAEVADRCRSRDVLLHIDACQTVGRIPVDLTDLGADLLSASAAKLGAGRGVGFLAAGPRARLAPLQTGDERERRRRAGLEDLPGIAALAEVLLQLRPADPTGPAAGEASRCEALRRRLRDGLAGAAEDVALHGSPVDAAPHIVAASALYVDGRMLVEALDRAGFAVHSGSSCAATAGEPSHVLVAMGALTHGHVRLSVGPGVTETDIDEAVGAFSHAVADLRAASGPLRHTTA